MFSGKNRGEFAMYAIEFETEITGKYIELADYERVVNKHAKVILLFEDQEPDNRLPVEKIFLIN
jgi:hypothetical protein